MSAYKYHRNLQAAANGKPQWVQTKGGKVYAYHRAMLVENVSVHIWRNGVAKCQDPETRKRRVCAWFKGDLNEDYKTWPVMGGSEWKRLSFDPRQDDEFLADGVPFNRADAASMTVDGSCYILNPRWED